MRFKNVIEGKQINISVLHYYIPGYDRGG